MNPEIAFIGHIGANPGDRTAVKVYADWLQEFRGLSRFTALRTATKPRRDTITRRELASAAALFARKGPARARRMREIQKVCDVSWIDRDWVVIVPGSRPPKHTATATKQTRTGDAIYGFTVGARWLLELEKTLHPKLSATRQRDRVKKRKR